MRLTTVVDTLGRSVTMEMDLRLEAAAYAELAENVKDDPDVHVPAVDWDRSAREVLTTEWIDGIKLSDRAGLRRRARSPEPRPHRHAVLPAAGHARRLLPCRHAPGNLFVDEEGRLVVVVCGIMGRLGLRS